MSVLARASHDGTGVTRVMTTMTLDQAKAHLADLLAKAAEGEEVVIVRDDGSTFAVVPTQAPARPHSDLNGRDREPTGMVDDAHAASGEPDPDAKPSQRRPRRDSFGILKSKIWIAPDFDDIPEGFEPYLGDDDVGNT